jgi:hypothetical protein
MKKPHGPTPGVSIPPGVDLSTAKGFLDVLFGVLLGFLISEAPVTDFHSSVGFVEKLFLITFYVTIIAKLFLHWLALRTDLAVAETFLRERARIQNFALAVLVGCIFILNAKILLRWFAAPVDEVKTLVWFFGLMLVFRVGDQLVNSRTVPGWVNTRVDEFDASSDPSLVRQKPARSALRAWYGSRLQRALCLYLMHDAIYFVAALVVFFRGWWPEFMLAITLMHVVTEVIIEKRLHRGRNLLLGLLSASDSDDYHFLRDIKWLKGPKAE